MRRLTLLKDKVIIYRADDSYSCPYVLLLLIICIPTSQAAFYVLDLTKLLTPPPPVIGLVTYLGTQVNSRQEHQTKYLSQCFHMDEVTSSCQGPPWHNAFLEYLQRPRPGTASVGLLVATSFNVIRTPKGHPERKKKPPFIAAFGPMIIEALFFPQGWLFLSA